MKTEIIQQEIVFFTNTNFSQRELCEMIESTDNKSYHSVKEKWQEACWNGLLSDLLPEVISNKKLFMWKIQEGNSFLCIDLSEQPSDVDSYSSINPYLFLSAVNNN